MPENDNTDLKTLAQGYLRAYCAEGVAALKLLAGVPDWQGLAQRELERRATLLVQFLDNDLLRAIAAGEIDIPALCHEIAAREESLHGNGPEGEDAWTTTRAGHVSPAAAPAACWRAPLRAGCPWAAGGSECR